MQFPKIFTGCTVRWGKAKYKETGNVKEAPLPEEGEENGENLIRDHWTQGTGSITDMRVVNTDAVSYQSKTLEKCLETSEFKKKKNYLNACLNERQHFTPFVALADGIIGVKTEATLKRITIRLAQNWKETY